MEKQNVTVKMAEWDVEIKTKVETKNEVKVGDRVIIDGLDSVIVAVEA